MQFMLVAMQIIPYTELLHNKEVFLADPYHKIMI